MKQIKTAFKLIAPLVAGLATALGVASSNHHEEINNAGRAADAPVELEGFAFLVGCFELDTFSRDDGNGWKRVGGGKWAGRWAQNGWAFMMNGRIFRFRIGKRIWVTVPIFGSMIRRAIDL